MMPLFESRTWRNHPISHRVLSSCRLVDVLMRLGLFAQSPGAQSDLDGRVDAVITHRAGRGLAMADFRPVLMDREMAFVCN